MIKVGFFLFILATGLQLVIKAYDLNVFYVVFGILALLASGVFIYYNNNKSDKKEREIKKAYYNELLAKKLASNDDKVEESSKDKK